MTYSQFQKENPEPSHCLKKNSVSLICQVWLQIQICLTPKDNKHICPFHLHRLLPRRYEKRLFCPAQMRRMECFLLHPELSLNWLQGRNSGWNVSGFSGSCLHILVERSREELVMGKGWSSHGQPRYGTLPALSHLQVTWLQANRLEALY